MSVEPVLTNILIVLLFFGGPLLPLLVLATEIERWHRTHADPPADKFTSD